MERSEMDKHIGRRFHWQGTPYDIVGVMENLDDEPAFAVSPVLGTTVTAFAAENAVQYADEFDKGRMPPEGLCRTCDKAATMDSGYAYCASGYTFYKVDSVSDCGSYVERKPERVVVAGVEDPMDDVIVSCISSVMVNVKDIADAPLWFAKTIMDSLEDESMGIRFDCHYFNRSDQRVRVVVAGEVVGILPGRVVVS